MSALERSRAVEISRTLLGPFLEINAIMSFEVCMLIKMKIFVLILVLTRDLGKLELNLSFGIGGLRWARMV